jgi:hypothetical protein
VGKPEPLIESLSNVSLRKYLPWIKYWGGWGLFQEMLAVLGTVAKKHSVSIPNVAVSGTESWSSVQIESLSVRD